MQSPLMWIVNALNAIRSNVWCICLIIAGSVLTLHGHGDVGGSLITGGFAIFRTSSTDPNQEPKKEQSNGIQPKL